MHDTFLLKRISESLSDLIIEYKLSRVIKLRITTSMNSHIHTDNLYEHLLSEHNGIIGEWTEIIIEKQDIDDLTAVIESIEGESLELMQ